MQKHNRIAKYQANSSDQRPSEITDLLNRMRQIENMLENIKDDQQSEKRGLQNLLKKSQQLTQTFKHKINECSNIKTQIEQTSRNHSMSRQQFEESTKQVVSQILMKKQYFSGPELSEKEQKQPLSTQEQPLQAQERPLSIDQPIIITVSLPKTSIVPKLDYSCFNQRPSKISLSKSSRRTFSPSKDRLKHLQRYINVAIGDLKNLEQKRIVASVTQRPKKQSNQIVHYQRPVEIQAVAMSAVKPTMYRENIKGRLYALFGGLVVLVLIIRWI